MLYQIIIIIIIITTTSITTEHTYAFSSTYREHSDFQNLIISFLKQKYVKKDFQLSNF